MLDPQFKRYLEERNKFKGMPWRLPSVLEMIRYYKVWKSCQLPGRTPLDDEIPWITFSAISFLEKNLTKTMRVFEYGSGGSSVFIARRVQSLVSVEHDSFWGKIVAEKLASCLLDNCRIKVVPPHAESDAQGKSPADPAAYVSSNEQYAGYSFRDYVQAIDSYGDGEFDLVLIDGRARPSCFARALPKVVRGGFICWDNTEREHYAPAMKLAGADFDFYDFPGPSPYVNFFTRTSVWQRR